MNRIFKELLSLHGYPLPFESSETVAQRTTAAAAAYGPRYGNRSEARRLFGPAAGAPRPAAAEPHGCTAGACG